MKKLTSLILFLLSLTSFIYSQNTQLPELQKLNLQVSTLYQQGKLNEAAAIAQKIVEIQRAQSSKDFQNLAIAINNLATIQKMDDEILGKEILNPNLSNKELSDIRMKRANYYDSIPALFSEVIKLYEEKLKIKDLNLAGAEFELASFFTENQGKFPGSKSVDTEKFEKLYDDSLSIRKKILGEDDDLTLSTILHIANFHQFDAEFEKSLPLYINFINAVKKKYGGNSEYLLPALRTYSQILAAIHLNQEVSEIQKQIFTITGKPESLPEYNLDLTLRNKVNKTAELMESSNNITKYLKKEKFLLVNVLIDEKGQVIEIKAADTQDKDIQGKNVQERAEKEVINWRFKPFIYEGSPKKIKGIIWYPYFIRA